MKMRKFRHKTWRIFWVLCVVGLSIACYIPALSAEPTQSSQSMQTTGQDITAQPFMEVTIPARLPEKLVILSMQTGESQEIIRIILMVPENLLQADIYVNDHPVQADIAGDEVTLDLEGNSAAKVSIQFNINGSQAAACTLDVEQPLEPGGDCTW